MANAGFNPSVLKEKLRYFVNYVRAMYKTVTMLE
jgi:hypothetical protein